MLYRYDIVGCCSLPSDQTPTPTRFLRTCEESGLFQELEEANPFEQDFKDATPTSGTSKAPLSIAHVPPATTRM